MGNGDNSGPGAFVAELTRVHPLTFLLQENTVFLRNGLGVIRFEGTPHRKQNSSLLRTIHLHAKVSISKAIGHVVGSDYIIACRNIDLGIEIFDIRTAKDVKPQVHGRSTLSPVEKVAFIVFTYARSSPTAVPLMLIPDNAPKWSPALESP